MFSFRFSHSASIIILPSITSITPSTGLYSGGTSVTITGVNFGTATDATIGGTSIGSFSVVNSTTITGTTPAKAAGFYNVVVVTPQGNATLTNGFQYTDPRPTVTSISPNSGPHAGGTFVTITGTHFTGATSADIYQNLSSFTVVNDTTITGVTGVWPFSVPGQSNVNVVTPSGTATLSLGYTYT